ncbi:2-succinyl-5-enolpyruvyl-6-hydroxy-3-cyclohexene-1-carboxylic-acid synthase [Nonlabens marinus S1-08]|uniref:2-succinyl-5-enolpyruvyl-6-hydroxy-3-cyclohexene-1-carboxylate synthase n=1 Tax=Nonlabens marinus S1-08 TaxID=1454201 RepID=W8W0P6_9FLAO|nr:2-succinyl-5-enolpyruvyl-6-hydroxy-3-cyclohexene-1-carboxylic-acid synthase [Nonlabens marinus S1-08]
MTIGFTADDFFKCYSIVDERCAAHFALGIAQQLQEPVAILCTSGSAMLNYYPAVAEAFYSEIPLIVLSADRPPHKIDIGDGQTIRQQHVYANHILFDTQLEMIHNEDQTEYLVTNERAINKAINISISKNGPVHLNIPFEEPLYKKVEQFSLEVKVMDVLKDETTIIPDQFFENWNKAKRKLIILSTLNPPVFEKEDLDLLSSDPSVLIMSEVSANVVHKNIVWGIDTLIAPIEFDDEQIAALQPDLVVTIGGMIVSKKIKQYLRRFETKIHYHIGKRRAYDTFFKLAAHIKMPPRKWLQQLPTDYLESNYQQQWLDHFKMYLDKKPEYIQRIPWSDFKIFDLIFNQLPGNITLQLGNSSTIRYAQLFKMNDTHRVFSNRGTSGIDGCTSTAIGAAVGGKQQTILITGDVSFFYDSNALWNNYIPDNFKIILINNSGGGIFRILPGEKDESYFSTFFETTHQLDATHLCKMHDVGYHKVGDEFAFAKAYNSFINDNTRPQLLEIFTPREVNDEILLGYFKYLK